MCHGGHLVNVPNNILLCVTLILAVNKAAIENTYSNTVNTSLVHINILQADTACYKSRTQCHARTHARADTLMHTLYLLAVSHASMQLCVRGAPTDSDVLMLLTLITSTC